MAMYLRILDLKKATWDVIGFDGHLVVGTINFTLPKTPTISYHIGQSLNKDIIKIILKMILNVPSQIQWDLWLILFYLLLSQLVMC